MVAAASAILDAVVPPSLKLVQLQRVAFLCGLATSGTKTDIRERIAEAAATAAAPAPARGRGRGAVVDADSRRILSIDLGLRNLAYCLLTPAPSPPPKATTTTGHGGPPPLRPPPVDLHAWSRIDLVKKVPPPSLTTTTSSSPLSPSAEKRQKQKQQQQQSEAFSPAALAVTAVRLVRETLLPLGPTHVLVERQRFRSGGAAPVLEWTLRVNTLEAMVHAAFRTLRECGHWDGEVVSVAPSRVGPFWLGGGGSEGGGGGGSRRRDGGEDGAGDEAESKAVARRKTKLHMKKEKIDILGDWLERGKLILPQNEGAEAMIETYFQHWRRKPHSRRQAVRNESGASDEEVIKKIDDLADSLLQGMAWIRWEENKTSLRSTEGIMELSGQ